VVRFSAVFVVAGDVFVALGFLIVFFLFKDNSFTSATIEVGQDQKVVSTAPYRIVRHPMYAGAVVMLLFVPWALGSYWGFLFARPVLVVIIWQLLNEEKFLEKKLPSYDEYCRKTRYWVGSFGLVNVCREGSADSGERWQRVADDASRG
jgi:protein-S-isoprenylcysteine O-methyltransferase Ste14